jgi:hypothetical protein
MQDVIKKIQNKTATAKDKQLFRLMQAQAVSNAERVRRKSKRTGRK